MKPILFLGAKSDIAKTTAELYAKKGYNLYLAGRQVNTELIDFSSKLTEKYGCNVELFELDILAFETHQNFFKSLPYKPEGVLCFIGYLGDQKESELDFKESRKIIDNAGTKEVHVVDFGETAQIGYGKTEGGDFISINACSFLYGARSLIWAGNIRS